MSLLVESRCVPNHSQRSLLLYPFLSRYDLPPFNYVTRNPRNSTYRSIVTGTYLIFHPFSSLQIRISIRFVERSGYRILVSISVTSTWIEIFLLLDDPLSFSSRLLSTFLSIFLFVDFFPLDSSRFPKREIIGV